MRSVTTREPLFTEQDRAELLALALYRDGLCPKCGRPVDECTSDEEAGPSFGATYKVCRSTLALLEAQRALSDGGKKPRPNAPAYLWGTTMRKR